MGRPPDGGALDGPHGGLFNWPPSTPPARRQDRDRLHRERRGLADAGRKPIRRAPGRGDAARRASYVKASVSLGAGSLADAVNRVPRAVLSYATHDEPAAAAAKRLIT